MGFCGNTWLVLLALRLDFVVDVDIGGSAYGPGEENMAWNQDGKLMASC